MFSGESSHDYPSALRHHRRCRAMDALDLGVDHRPRGFGTCRLGSNHKRQSAQYRRGRDNLGWGHEGTIRLNDYPVLERTRTGPLDGVMEGLGRRRMLEEGRGLVGSPMMMPRGPLGPDRGPRFFEHRSPMLDDDPLVHQVPYVRHGLHELGDMGGPYMTGGLGGLRSPLRSPHLPPGGSVNNFDLHQMDRMRSPFGLNGHGPSNYRPPYVEDYESDMDGELIRRQQLAEFLEARDGIVAGDWYDNDILDQDLFRRGGY
ncbi:hypothetical protein B7494_g85 [Chlorociboria aeruginascens]|nr:hypothetical protein B7494_g85 [Chlorociboria aeruginascens]